MKPLKRLRWLIDRALHFGGFGCSDIQHLLFDYVEGDLPEETCRKLDQHLADCPGCVRYVQSYKKTVQLTHEHCHPKNDIPPELQKRLREFIRENPQLRS